MRRRSSLVALICALLPSLASALSVPLLPAGMCVLSDTIPAQATIIEYFKSSEATGNELITSFASCDELKAIDDKKAVGVSHYGSVYRQSSIANLTMTREDYLKTVAATFSKSGELTDVALASVGALTGQVASSSGVESPKSVGAQSKGILYQDPRMVIIGMEQTNSFSGKQTRVASTAAMTLIGGSPISVNLYAPLSDPDAFAGATEKLKPVINSMVRENK